MKKGNPEKKASRIDARADKKMANAQSSWRKAEAIRKSPAKSNSNFAKDDFAAMNQEGKANRLYSKSARKADAAKDLKTRATIIRAGAKKK